MRVVLLNSGGLDSAMLAAWLQKEDHEVYSLFVDHRQVSAEAQTKAASETAKRYCVDHHVVKLDMGYTSNYWQYDDVVEPHDVDHPKTDFRNFHVLAGYALVLTSMAVSYGKMVGANAVYTGAKGQLENDFPGTFNSLLTKSNRFSLLPEIAMPLLGYEVDYKTIAERFGLKVTDFTYTHSCRWNSPCGLCYKCKKRLEF